MNPERLAEIRADVPRCHAMMDSCQTVIGEICPANEDHVLVNYATELLAYIDELTRQLEDARRLALPAFTSPEGDLSEHTHVLDEPEIVRDLVQAKARMEAADESRPSAYDMPVGSVVVAHDYDGNPQAYTRCHADDNGGWARWTTDPGELTKPATTQSGWIEGLFTDGLVTEWRLP
jgi:hypothetical protein